ncbi:hypothetical protein CYMTET_55482 [Cymbomonas tetramitiformis]|uniref:Chromo domain-containing protein n=1 Tax=Cymbomonas tetramitiformis TaxID=36881 RepID=A0AAE0EMS6_9CHLO|nr:hypothetical protein CYMTET_55482 [Cymbomonas tetramitiformis]
MPREKGAKPRHGTRSSSPFTALRAQGAGPVKRTQQIPFDPAGQDGTDYTVREIKAGRLKYGVSEWLVGWEGLEDINDMWEPVEHLAGCEGQIKAFRERAEVEKKKAEEHVKEKKRKACEENVDNEGPQQQALLPRKKPPNTMNFAVVFRCGLPAGDAPRLP